MEINMANNLQKKNTLSAVFLTVAICIVLASAAIIIAILNPQTDFDFIPSYASPGEVHFSEMEYVRPDPEALCDTIDELITMINEGSPFSNQSKLFTDINQMLSDFYTMQTIANIRFYSNNKDEFWSEENSFVESNSVLIYDKTNELLDIIAASDFKPNYERSFFGSGYFEEWQPYDLSSAALKLLMMESELITKYQTAIAEASVEYNGENIRIPSAEYNSLDPNAAEEVLVLYFEKYNYLLGNIYAELAKVRLQLAEELDVEYVDYAYKSLGRDYSPDDAAKYIEDVRTHIVPLMSTINPEDSIAYTYTDTMTSFYYVSKAAHNMGGVIEEAFDYMVKYGLYDIAYSENKTAISFQTFIQNYNSPFLFVSPTLSVLDYLSFAHELGHFVDSYSNLNMGITIDNTEIASQAFELIAPMYSNGMGNISKDELMMLSLISAIDTYATSGFINTFETAVYSLDPEEITLEKLNSIAFEAAEAFGLDPYTVSMSWFEIQHLYIAPFYSVGYAISNDVSIQVLEKELDDPGEGGVKAYLNVIDRDTSLSFVDDITKSGFKSPFEEGRVKEVADFIDLLIFSESKNNDRAESEPLESA